MILLDVGVWLAAVWGRHAHHPVAANWLTGQTDDLLFCRVTQMGLLRLLSNPAIMGEDAVDRSVAWRVFDQLWADERVLWADEPDELDAVWRALSARDDKSHKLWTDDYLAAFAQTSGATLATLDRKLPARYPSARVESLLSLPGPPMTSDCLGDGGSHLADDGQRRACDHRANGPRRTHDCSRGQRAARESAGGRADRRPGGQSRRHRGHRGHRGHRPGR